MTKTVEYKAKGYNGKRVSVPSKYVSLAKGLVRDVLELKDKDVLHELLTKKGYGGSTIYGSAKELFLYKTTYNPSDGESSKQKLRELKDNVYLNVCAYGADKINGKKIKKVKKKSDEEILRINKEHQKMKERIEKILRDS